LRSQAYPEVTAFVRLLRVNATIRRELEARLVRSHGLTVKDYEALVALARAEDGYLRRVDLAEQVLLTPSGITRLLDGLERLGLVEKGHCPTDARVTYAVITDAGRTTAAAAEEEHDRLLREQIGGSLDAAELETLIELLGRLPGADTSACALDVEP
jgi:DNA-binding MarR family transcriptional regulator